MKVIHFGAGNIGRGFISPILKLDSKIEAIKFVDVNEKIVNEMNETKKYYVNELSQEINQILVTDISAILTKNLFNDENLEYLKDVNLVTTSIGENNLHFITNELIKLINLKQAQNQPLIVISAENGNRVSSYLKELIKDQVSLEQIYFVDAVVDRIVPRQKAAGLNIDVEKYYSWIVDEKQWPKKIERITSISYSNNIEGEISKKISLLNGVHAALAWHRFGVDKFKIKTIREALNQGETQIFIDELYQELIPIISQQYGFSITDLTDYKNQLLARFKNPYLVDELERVGRNPITKLQKDERILKPLFFAVKNNLPYQHLLNVVNDGLNYQNENDFEAQQMKELIDQQGKKAAIKTLIKGLSIEEEKVLN